MDLIRKFNRGIVQNSAIVFLFPNISVNLELKHNTPVLTGTDSLGYILYNDTNNNLSFFPITKIIKKNIVNKSEYTFYHDENPYIYSLLNKVDSVVKKIYIANEAYIGLKFYRSKESVREISKIKPLDSFINPNQTQKPGNILLLTGSGPGKILTVYLKN